MLLNTQISTLCVRSRVVEVTIEQLQLSWMFVRTWCHCFAAVCEKKMLLLTPVKAAASVLTSAELLLDVTHWCEKKSKPTELVPSPREWAKKPFTAGCLHSLDWTCHAKSTPTPTPLKSISPDHFQHCCLLIVIPYIAVWLITAPSKYTICS